MKLELHKVAVKDAQWGDKTHVDGGVLYVKKEEALAVVLQDARFVKADLEIARPGESVRIIPVKDVIEPRIKMDGSGYFPGYCAPMRRAGEGKANQPDAAHRLPRKALQQAGKTRRIPLPLTDESQDFLALRGRQSGGCDLRGKLGIALTRPQRPRQRPNLFLQGEQLALQGGIAGRGAVRLQRAEERHRNDEEQTDQRRAEHHRQRQPIETRPQFRQQQIDLLAHGALRKAAPMAARHCAWRDGERNSGKAAKSITSARSMGLTGR